ncbi:MAG: methyltransferase domain-containing protein [Burkholderiales bacterium]|nr:methyltransferase domain-containing protein [Burkholderiales bacterium]
MLHVLKNVVRGALVCAALLAPQVFAAEIERTGGPYVPTPQVVVDQMLGMAKVGPDDFVIDLGSGDGVIVLTAAHQLKARGFGVEIDPDLVKRSNNEAKRLGIADRAQFQVQDVFKADLSRATVLTLYLLPDMMKKLSEKVYSELRPGARVVSHDYHFGAWQHDDEIAFDVPEKENVNGVPKATLYLWIVPAKVAGAWRIAKADGRQYDARLNQEYRNFSGTVNLEGRNIEIQQQNLRGMDIGFTVVAGNARHIYRGRVTGDRIEGTVDLGGGKSAKWTATRAAKTALQ